MVSKRNDNDEFYINPKEMKTITSIFIVLLLLMCSNTSKAQLLKKLGEKITNTTTKVLERKAEQKTEEAVNKTVDKAIDKATNSEIFKAKKNKKNKKNKKDKVVVELDSLSGKEEKIEPITSQKTKSEQNQ